MNVLVLVLVNVNEINRYYAKHVNVYVHEHVHVEHNTANKPNINLSLFYIAPYPISV